MHDPKMKTLKASEQQIRQMHISLYYLPNHSDWELSLYSDYTSLDELDFHLLISPIISYDTIVLRRVNHRPLVSIRLKHTDEHHARDVINSEYCLVLTQYDLRQLLQKKIIQFVLRCLVHCFDLLGKVRKLCSYYSCL